MTEMEKALGIIPARLNSTRLPRKMLATIGGKPLIYHTWRQAKKAKMLDAVVIATDSREIKEVAEAFGADVVMTSPSIKTGSDRVAAAVEKFQGFKPDIVLNIQGDEPMLPPSAINLTAKILIEDKKAVMATVATPLLDIKELKTPTIVKVVCDKEGNALYFSRSPLPWLDPYEGKPYAKFLKHIGLYGFRRDFLPAYVKLPQTPLEKAERLEQLRALEHGYKIKVGVGKFERVEVNNARELAQVRRLFSGKFR